MKEIENLRQDVKEVHELANEVAKRANNEVSVLKHKITCLTILVGLLFVLGACISIYSIHSMKELFYDMEIEETTYENEIDAGDGGNAIGIIGDNNEVNANGED